MELQLLENDRQYLRKIAVSILMGSMNGGKIINTDTVLTCLTQDRNLGILTMRIHVLSIILVKTNIGI